MNISPLFNILEWYIGYEPMMFIQNKVRPLDCVAMTCMDSPFINTRTKVIRVNIKIPDGLEREFVLENDRWISCMDIVDYLNVNIFSKEQYKVFNIYLKQNICYFILSIEEYPELNYIERTKSFDINDFSKLYDSEDESYISL
tara:strand:- start:623 stop:1051 length:429 start_codon:yes stop_codon:yes gene_type:complete